MLMKLISRGLICIWVLLNEMYMSIIRWKNLTWSRFVWCMKNVNKIPVFSKNKKQINQQTNKQTNKQTKLYYRHMLWPQYNDKDNVGAKSSRMIARGTRTCISSIMPNRPDGARPLRSTMDRCKQVALSKLCFTNGAQYLGQVGYVILYFYLKL